MFHPNIESVNMKPFIIILLIAFGLYAWLSYFAQTVQSVRTAAQEPVDCTTDADCAEKFPNVNPW